MRLRKLPFQGLLIAICIFLGCTTNKMVRNENESLEDLLLLWSKIDSLESNQLDRSSLALVEQAAVMAKQLHQSQYHLKALLTRIQLEQHLGDIGNLSMISQLEDAISLAETGVDRALLQSMLGQYYAVRASEMNGSAANLEGNESEIEFMSQRLLSNRADSLYDLSISTIHPEDLDEYELLVVPKEYDVVTFSTVSDLLFWRAINHFEKDVEGWLDASIYRSLAGDKVLSLYDRWLNDSQNSDSNRRVRIELKRLDLLNQHFRGPIDKRHDAYLHALDLLQSKYGPTPSCLHEIAMKRAAFLFSLPRTDYEEARSQAHQLAHNVLLRNPSAEIAASANGLIQSIEHPYLSLEVESVLLPQEHFLIRINHTNVDELELKIVPVDFDPLKRRNSNRNQEKEWDSYSRSASIHKEVHTLPKHKDFHSHSTDWIGPKLAAGHYILLVESKSSGRLRLMQELTVSGLSYRIHRGAEQNNVYVSDRANGEPKAGVHCTVYRWEWQQEGRGLVKIKDTNTGGDGALSIAAPLANQILLHMVDGEDQLWSEQVYFWHNRDDGMPSPSTQFYTDRAIYRPGDKIRFTCLLVQPKQNAPSALVVGQDLEITYHDANGEKIASLKGVTDEFGRITGEFEVPSDRLLGLMTLRTSFGQQSIRVEAYKKPTFSISLALEDSLPQLGKAVTVGGVVNSFVGFPIGGASVRYTI